MLTNNNVLVINGHNTLRSLRIQLGGWGETTCTLIPWMYCCSHPTRNQCIGSFTLCEALRKIQ